jgi:hypothetical protein
MSLFISVGNIFRQQPASTVTWSTTFGSGLDRRIVIQAPNISDDILGPRATRCAPTERSGQ